MMKNILKEKQNLLIIGAIVLTMIVIAVVCLIFKKDQTTMTQETLEDNLKKIGTDFYENYYYSNLNDEDKTEKLPIFKETGIKIDLTNVELLVEIDEDVKKQLEKDKCDYDKTKILIYPKEPYGQKDYALKIELSCEK